MMTTLSTAIGLLPIALGFGAGGRARMPLGVAVIVGLLVTTLLTLVVVPVVYTLMDALRRRLPGSRTESAVAKPAAYRSSRSSSR
jgi:Cu/Ag efflux pump CusA